MTLTVILFYLRSYIVKRFIRSIERSQLGLYNYKGIIFHHVRALLNAQIVNVLVPIAFSLRTYPRL